MSKKYRIVPTDTDAPVSAPASTPDWSTGLCSCWGENACCSECCLVAVGLDFLLYKDTEEWYTERSRGARYSRTGTFVPDAGTLEAFLGGTLCRGLGVLLTCGLAAGSGGVFDLFWCYGLARQRRQVRELYHIDSDACADCFVACCCRCCMFNQLKHQLQVDNPDPPDQQPQQVNSMSGLGKIQKPWWISKKAFNNPSNGDQGGEYV